MRQPFDEVVRVRVPAALNDRLRTTADRYARSASDVIREWIVLQLDRLGHSQSVVDPDWRPPEAA